MQGQLELEAVVPHRVCTRFLNGCTTGRAITSDRLQV
jgi:hypothetical protein